MRAPVPRVLLLLATALWGGLAGGAARAEEGAVLVFDRMRHDFGRAGQEEELTASFTYRNAGDASITGIRAIGDCGCYGVILSHDALAPGEEGTMRVDFRTLMFSGGVTKRLKVTTESPTRELYRIELHVDVISGVILDPGRVWFGDVLLGEAPSQQIVAKWHTEGGRPFEVTGVEVPGEAFAVTQEPFSEGPWRGTTITFAFRTPPPLGLFSASALVRTDHPTQSRISLPITANVTGHVWVQSRSVTFGWVQKGTSKRTSIVVHPFGDGIDLGTVDVRSRRGHVKVGVEPYGMGREGWYRVVLEVPESRDLGRIDDVVEVHSEVPGEEVTEIVVRGEVVDLGR